MDQSTQPLHSVIGVVASSAQIAYAAPAYQPAAMVNGAPAVIGTLSTQAIPANQVAYHQVQQFHHQQQQHQQQLRAFWASQMSEIEQSTDFKNHSLPLARIKKIMKSDEDVRMISAEAPVIFAKACELFILELTLRAWIHTEENKRRTLQKNDIAAAITRTDIFDFLVDIVPRDELKDEGLGILRAALPTVGGPADALPYYYVPAQNQVPGPAMIVGNPVDQTAAVFAAQQLHPVAYMWQHPQTQSQQQQPQPHQLMPESDG